MFNFNIHHKLNIVSVSDVFDQGEQLAPVEQVLSVKRQFATLNLIFVLII
jgi:hypothetical protein